MPTGSELVGGGLAFLGACIAFGVLVTRVFPQNYKVSQAVCNARHDGLEKLLDSIDKRLARIEEMLR